MLTEDESNSSGKQCETDAVEREREGKKNTSRLTPHATQLLVGLKGAIKIFAITGSFLFFFYSKKNTPPPPNSTGSQRRGPFTFVHFLDCDCLLTQTFLPRRINMPEPCRNQHVSCALFHSGSVTDRQSLLTLSFSLPPPIPRTPGEAAARELGGTARPHFNGPSIISRLFS